MAFLQEEEMKRHSRAIPGALVGWLFLALSATAAGAQKSANAPITGAVAEAELYSREPVQVRSGGAILAGSLLLPDGAGTHPAALLIPGAAGSTNLPGVAEHLAEQGIAVLDLNKRGVGGSTGRWDRQGFRGRADDVIAGLEFLRSHPDVDPLRIGLVGHSQGGWIAQMVAAEREDVAFLVLLAGPGQTVRDQILAEARIYGERRSLPEAQVEKQVASLRRQLGLARTGAPLCRALRAHYICHIIDFDPTPYLERIQVPVLALFAELDPMVPPEPNVELVRSALERAGNADVTLHVFPRTNHDFWEARTGLWDEYPELERVYVAGFLDRISTWIVERGGCSHGPASSSRYEPEDSLAEVPHPSEERGRAAKGRHTLLPLPALFYTPDTGWAGGASVLHSYRSDPDDPSRWPTTGELSLIYTQNEQVLASAVVDHSTRGNRWRMSASATHVLFPDAFYGIGSDLPAHAREAYTSRSSALMLGVRRRVGPGLFLGGGYSLSRFSVLDVEADGALAGAQIRGSGGGTVSSLGLGVTLDTRDHWSAPARGTYLDLRFRRAARLVGSDFDYGSHSLDFRRYITVGCRPVVALQAYGGTTTGDVPFQMLPRMGGSHLMRGYNPNRFRDRSLLAAQAEVRAPLGWRLGAVGFAGAGNVAPSLPRLAEVRPQVSYGAGVRLLVRSKERLNLRADYAFAQDGRRLYLGIGEAF
jgi:uncharacterized protein